MAERQGAHSVRFMTGRINAMWLTFGTLLAGVVLAALAAPPAATAAERHAAPGSALTTPCTVALPCSLNAAFNNAAAGDEVVAAPGEYPITTSLSSSATSVTLRGITGQPRPHITSSMAFPLYLKPGQTLRHVALTFSPPASYTGVYAKGSGITVEDVVADYSGSAGGTLIEFDQAPGAVVRNSAMRIVGSTSATPMYIANSLGVQVRNVTAVSAGAQAILVWANVADASATIRNTIARGGTGPNGDIRAAAGAALSVSADIDHSNFGTTSTSGAATLVTGTHNQMLAPLFADQAAGDLHQAALSPTVDAGVVDPLNGTSDYDGDARTIAGAPDIGADELVPAPVAATAAADAITTTGAKLHGTVNPNGAATTYRFEYGTTTSYGSTTPVRALSAGTVAQVVGETISGLSPDTTYHLRLVATNATGTTVTADRTLRTERVPEPPPTTTEPTTTPTEPPATTTEPPTGGDVPLPPVAQRPPVTGLRVTPTRFTAGRVLPRIVTKAQRGTATIRFTLSDDARVRFTFQRRVGRRHVRAGSVTVSVRAGSRMLRFAGRLSARTKLRAGRYRVTVTATTAAGLASRPATATFTVIAQR